MPIPFFTEDVADGREHTLCNSTDDSNLGGVVDRADGCASIQRDFKEIMGLLNVCGKVLGGEGRRAAEVASVGEGKGLPYVSHSQSSQSYNSPITGQSLSAHDQACGASVKTYLRAEDSGGSEREGRRKGKKSDKEHQGKGKRRCSISEPLSKQKGRRQSDTPSVRPSDRKRGNVHKLKHAKFHLNIRRQFFTVVESKRFRNMLPSYLVESPSLEAVHPGQPAVVEPALTEA